MTRRNAAIATDDASAVEGIVETLVQFYVDSRRVTKGLARQYGLTGPQMMVIQILEEVGDMSLSSLSTRLGARNSTVTGIIDRMEREDLVERSRSEEDRRIVLIRLTKKGRKLADEIQIDPMEVFRETLASLPKKDIAELSRILETLTHRLRKAFAEEPLVKKAISDDEP